MDKALADTRSNLFTGVLIFRWVWLAWLVLLAASGGDHFVRPALAWAWVALVSGWTVFLTLARNDRPPWVPWVDLLLCFGLIVVSGLVVAEGVTVQSRPFFATGYPLSAALLWGATWGPGGGLVAGSALGIAQVLSRPINGVPLNELAQPQVQNLAGAVVNYLVAGAAVGIVFRFLARSAEAVERANAEVVRERERTARLAEREKIARQIHDSVLQALAFVHKKGRELTSRDPIPREEVARMASLAEQQEAELRALILREPEDQPSGRASLREELERVGRSVQGLRTTISAVGPLWLPAAIVTELAGAVRQALENVARHAQVADAVVFAEDEQGAVSVTVRDDGVGFVYDESRLVADRKVGITKSIKGRVEDLGGSFDIQSAPGKGTEIEMRVPHV